MTQPLASTFWATQLDCGFATLDLEVCLSSTSLQDSRPGRTESLWDRLTFPYGRARRWETRSRMTYRPDKVFQGIWKPSENPSVMRGVFSLRGSTAPRWQPNRFCGSQSPRPVSSITSYTLDYVLPRLGSADMSAKWNS